MKIEGLLTDESILAELGGASCAASVGTSAYARDAGRAGGRIEADSRAYRGRGHGANVHIDPDSAGIGTTGSAGNSGTRGRTASDGYGQAERQSAEAGQW